MSNNLFVTKAARHVASGVVLTIFTSSAMATTIQTDGDCFAINFDDIANRHLEQNFKKTTQLLVAHIAQNHRDESGDTFKLDHPKPLNPPEFNFHHNLEHEDFSFDHHHKAFDPGCSTEVPLPTPLVLFSSALAALGMKRRNRTK